MEANRVIGAALRQLREAAGLKQSDIAVAIGNEQSHISKLEAGQRALRVYELPQLAKALELDELAMFDTIIDALRNDQATGDGVHIFPSKKARMKTERLLRQGR